MFEELDRINERPKQSSFTPQAIDFSRRSIEYAKDVAAREQVSDLRLCRSSLIFI